MRFEPSLGHLQCDHNLDYKNKSCQKVLVEQLLLLYKQQHYLNTSLKIYLLLKHIFVLISGLKITLLNNNFKCMYQDYKPKCNQGDNLLRPSLTGSFRPVEYFGNLFFRKLSNSNIPAIKPGFIPGTGKTLRSTSRVSSAVSQLVL